MSTYMFWGSIPCMNPCWVVPRFRMNLWFKVLKFSGSNFSLLSIFCFYKKKKKNGTWFWFLF